MKMSQWYVQFKIWTHFFVQKRKNKIIFILLFCSVLFCDSLSFRWMDRIRMRLPMWIWCYYIFDIIGKCCVHAVLLQTKRLNWISLCTVRCHQSLQNAQKNHFKDSFLIEKCHRYFFFIFILSKIESSSEIFSIDIAAGPRNEHCFDLNIDFYQNDVVEPRPTVSMR